MKIKLKNKTLTHSTLSRINFKPQEDGISRFHVISSYKNWAVRKEAASRSLKVLPLKKDAIEFAKKFIMAGKRTAELVIHKEDGSVEKWLKPEQLKSQIQK